MGLGVGAGLMAIFKVIEIASTVSVDVKAWSVGRMSATGKQAGQRWSFRSRDGGDALRDEHLGMVRVQSGVIAEDNAHLAKVLVRDGQVAGERLVVEVDGQRVGERTPGISISARRVFRTLQDFARALLQDHRAAVNQRNRQSLFGTQSADRGQGQKKLDPSKADNVASVLVGR